MPKNTIFIVIDSLFYDRTIKTDAHNVTMPFLDKLRTEGRNYTNMYSEAPYTEAALVSLLCGIDTLKKGGYLLKLKNKETIMETFKNNGYDTFCNCVQPLVYPSYSYQGLTDEYYNICYDFETLWDYRLAFYYEKYHNSGLDDKTLNIIVKLLDDNLLTWQKFLNSLKNDDKITSFIRPYVNISNIHENIDLVTNEYNRFKKDRINYTKDLLEKGKEHPLFKIHTYNLSEKMSEDNMKKLYYRYKKIIHKIQRKNIIYNLRNNKLKFPLNENKKDILKSYMNTIYNRFLYEKIDYHIKSKKAAPSMYTTLKHFESWLLERKDTKPYFAYIHVDDCHRQEMFYTYDTDDFNLLDEEFKNIDNYMNNLPKNYRGNISYDVSLQYADNCLKKLYNFLCDNKMIDKVNIVICADHGSSYTFDPYRSNYVNNPHRENYNMPFVIWNKEMKHKEVNEFYNTKDIPATILDMNNLGIPKDYDGISTLNNKGRDYVLLENVNGGCPDYNLRDILLGIRNKKYCVVMNLNVNKNFSDGTIHSVYDLINDREELENLKDTIDKNKIKDELSIIKREFELLKEDIKKNNFLKG